MRNQIEQTKAWESLTPIQKKIHGRRVNMVEIQNHFIIARNIGKEQWIKEQNPTTIQKNIVLEMLGNN